MNEISLSLVKNKITAVLPQASLRVVDSIDPLQQLRETGCRNESYGSAIGIVGLGIVALGGSITALSGEVYPKAFERGRNTWAIGTLLIIGGTALYRQGSSQLRAYKELEETNQNYDNQPQQSCRLKVVPYEP